MTSTETDRTLSSLSPDPSPSPSEGSGLYHSPVGLFGFQADGVARCYWQYVDSGIPATLVVWDTGIGKTHLALATACLMVEDGLLDHLVVVAEASKISDWARDDTPRFTDLSVGLYSGPKRKEMLADLPQVLVMTYETGRNDICTFKPRSKAVAKAGPLTEALKGKRVLIVFDEASAKLRSRTSNLSIAWDYLINRTLRRQKDTLVAVSAMTATPVERDPESVFNLGRLLAPALSPTVAEFEERYVATRDIFGRVSKFQNLTPDTCAPNITPLNQVFAPITLRKRKSDEDVRSQFPAKVERMPQVFDLSEQHADFYAAVLEVLEAADISEQGAFTLMRQVAGHPASLLRSQSATAQAIVATVGEQALRSMEVTKVERMLAWQASMADQQTVIFTFFGQSILPLLHEALNANGYKVEINHGQMSPAQRQMAQDRFKAGQAQIFLSSDAGARGLNLGVGSGLLHYELPVLYSTFVQRSDRIHRIDSRSVHGHESITIDSLVAHGTAEDGVAQLMSSRNDWSDSMIDDDYREDEDPGSAFITAEQRKAMLAMSRRAARR